MSLSAWLRAISPRASSISANEACPSGPPKLLLLQNLPGRSSPGAGLRARRDLAPKALLFGGREPVRADRPLYATDALWLPTATARLRRRMSAKGQIKATQSRLVAAPFRGDAGAIRSDEPSDEGPLIDAVVLFPAFAAMEQQGGSPTRVLERLGLGNLEPSPQNVPKVSTKTLRMILDACAAEVEDPLFGVHIADQLANRRLYGLIHYLATTAATVGDAFAAVARHTHLLDRVTSIEWDCSGDEYVFSAHAADPNHFGAHGDMLLLAAARNRLTLLTNSRVNFVGAWMGNEPPDKRKLSRALGLRALEVVPASAGAILSKKVARLPLKTSDPALHQILSEHAALLGDSKFASESYGGLLSEILRRQFVDSESVTLASTARKLGMSVRTVQRRLVLEKTTFHDLVESVRTNLARNMLMRGERSVADVAYALQYGDVSAFSRAFRRWTGSTPGDILRSAKAAVRSTRH